jgi:CheY-like chemotaxis protein
MQAHTQTSVALPSSNDELAGEFCPVGSGECRITQRTVAQDSGPPEGTERLILVEDDPNVRKGTLNILKALGYHVHAYASGTELLAALDEDDPPIDMLLSDFNMPGLNGYELAEQLRALRPDTRVLLTSGMSEDSIASAVRPADWPHFIPKPFTTCSLCQKVREVLDGPTTSYSRVSDTHE